MARGPPPSEVDVAVLQALRDRADEGMTIFEVRNRVAADIDRIERALERCKARGLIETDREDDRLVITITDAGVEAVDGATDVSLVDRIRERLHL